MKKLAIITPYLENVSGGIGVYSKNYYHRIKGFYDTYLITPDIEHTQGRIIKAKPTQIYGKLCKLRPDIIDNSGGWWSLLLPCVIYKLSHPKTRLIHLFRTYPEISGWKKALYGALLKRCDKVCGNSAWFTQEIQKIFRLNDKIMAVRYLAVSGFKDDKRNRPINGI